MRRSRISCGRCGSAARIAAACAVLLLSLVSGAAGDSGTAALPWPERADGFASVNALGQNGTTGGAGGRVVTVRTQADLERYAALPAPMVLRIEGKIEILPFGKKMDVASNKTIVGVGADAAIVHGGFRLRSVKNIIVRNLTIRDSFVEGDWDGKTNDYDAIQIDDSHHVWIDHCHLTRMGDGLIDLRKTTDYVTVSWCILSDHNKAFGIGWTPNADRLRVTIHHTWLRGTFQRNPSFDNGTGHLYNNYLQDIKGYGNYSRGRAKVVVENSVFQNVQNPLQRDATAEMAARGNRMEKTAGREESGGGAGFDPRTFYAYKVDDVARVPELLKAKAGPQPDIGMDAPTSAPAQITVAADGSGDFRTVQEAVDAVPANRAEHTVIRIRPGTYRTDMPVVIPADRSRIAFRGEDAAKTVLVSGRTVKSPGPDGKEVGTPGSAAVIVRGSDFQAENVTFANDAPHVAQALAIYVDADRAAFRDCHFLGWQDTIRLRSGRQYFENCRITGRTDFIYGEGTAFFDRCRIECEEGGYITAANTPQAQPFGFVFSGCTVTTKPGEGKTYLGRPWRDFANVAFLNCDLGANIHPAGWHNWDKPEREKTARYAEYRSTGPGARVGARVSWSRTLTDAESAAYTVTGVLGGADGWDPKRAFHTASR